jgi:hypothetical protein
MSEQQDGPPAESPPEPRESAQRQLDRAPGERYRPRPGLLPSSNDAVPLPTDRRLAVAIGAPLLVAVVGSLLVAVLGSFDIGIGLMAVSGFIGWAVAVAVVWGGTPGDDARSRRATWAAVLAAGSVAVGFAILWSWSRVEGGAMDPFAYLGERFGPVAYVNVIVAAAVAFLRAR